MERISFDQFKKIEIKIGKIVNVERMEGSDKLLKLEVDFGVIASQSQTNADSPAKVFTKQNLGGQAQIDADKREVRQIIAGIGKFYEPESLIGKECPFVFNLETKIIKGLESQGMILCADDNGPVLLHPDKEIKPGSIVK